VRKGVQWELEGWQWEATDEKRCGEPINAAGEREGVEEGLGESWEGRCVEIGKWKASGGFARGLYQQLRCLGHSLNMKTWEG
jgi:hypothetical protein